VFPMASRNVSMTCTIRPSAPAPPFSVTGRPAVDGHR
jgi:hypothetical protein